MENHAGVANVSTYFTADPHYGHKNVIRFGNRPYQNVDEMNQGLVNTFNKRVARYDTLYIIGDVVWGHETYQDFLSRLNCVNVHLILGNHDNEINARRSTFLSVDHYKALRIGNDHIVLCHYPMRSWHRMEHGGYHLHGHTHNTLVPYARSMDVGIDVPFMEWGPKSWEEIKEEIDNRVKPGTVYMGLNPPGQALHG